MTLNLSNASIQEMIIHCEDTTRTILRRVVEFYPPMLDSFKDELQKRIINAISEFRTNDNQIPLNESTQLAKDDSPTICLDEDDHGGSIESEGQNVQDQMNCETRAIKDVSNDNNWSKPNDKIENHIKTLPTSKTSTSLSQPEIIHKQTANGETIRNSLPVISHEREASKHISVRPRRGTIHVTKPLPVISRKREASKYIRNWPRRETIHVTENVTKTPMISCEFKAPENVSKKPRLATNNRVSDQK